MAIDIKALNDYENEYVPSFQGGTFKLDRDKTGKDFHLRLMPHDGPNYYAIEKAWWIGDEFFVSPASWGDPCPVEEEINNAKKSNDPDLKARLDALTKGDMPKVNRHNSYVLPVLVLDLNFNGETFDFKGVMEDTSQFFLAPKTIIKAINKHIQSSMDPNRTKINERVLGTNFRVRRDGTGLKTEYSVEFHRAPMELDEKYYAELKNPFDYVKKRVKKDAMRNAVRHLLYGEDRIKESTDGQESFTTNVASSSKGGDLLSGLDSLNDA